MRLTRTLHRAVRGWLLKSAMLLTGLSVAYGAAVQESVLVVTHGSVTTITNAGATKSVVDFVNAKPKELPAVAPSGADAQMDLMNALSAPRPSGTPGSSAGSEGSGATHPVTLGAPAAESLIDELSTNLGIIRPRSSAPRIIPSALPG